MNMFSNEMTKRYVEDIIYFRMMDDPNYRCTEDLEIEKMAFLIKPRFHLEDVSEYWIEHNMRTFSNWPKEKEVIKLYIQLLFLELFKYDNLSERALRYFHRIHKRIIGTEIISFVEIENILTESFLMLNKLNEDPKQWLIQYFNHIPPSNKRLRSYYGIATTPIGYYNSAFEWAKILGYSNEDYGLDEILISSSFLFDFNGEHLKLSCHEAFLSLLTEELYFKRKPVEWENIFNVYEPYGDLIYNDVISQTLKNFERFNSNKVNYKIQTTEDRKPYITVYKKEISYMAFLSKEMYNWTSKLIEDNSNKISIVFTIQGNSQWANLYPHTDMIEQTKSILKFYILERLKIYRLILDELVLGFDYKAHDDLEKLLFYIKSHDCDSYFFIEKAPNSWIQQLKEFGVWEHIETPPQEFHDKLSDLKDKMSKYIYGDKGSFSLFHNIPY